MDTYPEILEKDFYVVLSFLISFFLGNKYCHAGFSKDDLTEVFTDEPSEISSIACGTNAVYAATNDGKIYSYTTSHLQPTIFNISNQNAKVKQLRTGDTVKAVLMEGK